MFGNMSMIVYCAIGTVILIILIRAFFSPLKIAVKGILNTALGLLGLLVFNTFGSVIGITLGFNLVTGVTVGLLGLPGLALLLFSNWALM